MCLHRLSAFGGIFSLVHHILVKSTELYGISNEHTTQYYVHSVPIIYYDISRVIAVKCERICLCSRCTCIYRCDYTWVFQNICGSFPVLEPVGVHCSYVMKSNIAGFSFVFPLGHKTGFMNLFKSIIEPGRPHRHPRMSVNTYRVYFRYNQGRR